MSPGFLDSTEHNVIIYYSVFVVRRRTVNISVLNLIDGFKLMFQMLFKAILELLIILWG